MHEESACVVACRDMVRCGHREVAGKVVQAVSAKAPVDEAGDRGRETWTATGEAFPMDITALPLSRDAAKGDDAPINEPQCGGRTSMAASAAAGASS
mmetsp:Transcript_23828/g.67010  ORF Transcript_23828/g.67010 Transcript_23828/m.67010 type:complete len:97 (+) Transcript_23828:293-583(+)